MERIAASWSSCFSFLQQNSNNNNNNNNNNSNSNSNDHEMRGVSVYHLQTILAQEVANYDVLAPTLSEDALDKTIYQLENLLHGQEVEGHQQQPGLIRRKGINIICPRDGKLGAAYVDCLPHHHNHDDDDDVVQDHVGRANLMLSYTWGNTYKDILDVLSFYCQRHNRNPKRTYVWICCLCNNQHRVLENLKNGHVVPFTQFQTTFSNKVLGIGNVLALISPWDDPIYLTRVWCIFELFTAYKHSSGRALNAHDEEHQQQQPGASCKLQIDMPQRARNALKQFIYDTTDDSDHVRMKFHQVLGNTAIQDANASVPADKENIMKLVQAEDGGYVALNNAVNDLLRGWLNDMLKEIFDHVKTEIRAINAADADADADAAAKKQPANNNTGTKDDTNDHESINNDSINVSNSINDSKTNKIKNCLENLGAVFQFHRYHDIALDCAMTNLQFCKTHFGEDDIMTSNPMNDLINIYRSKGQLTEAIEIGQKSLTIKEKIHGTNHPKVASTYYNMGRVYSDKRDFEMTLEYYNKALYIWENQLGTDHEKTATIYHSLGFIYHKKHDNNQAIEKYMKAMTIKENIALSNNGIKPSLATTYNSIGAVYAKKKELEKSLVYYFKALEIRKNILGNHHPSTKLTYKNIMLTYEKLGDDEKANEYRLIMAQLL